MSRRILVSLASMGVLVASLVAAHPSSAATNPFERGPAPTLASIQATTGPFAVSTTTVASSATGGRFGGGTIYFPTDTSQGTFGAIAIAPGFTERQSVISWLRPPAASPGLAIFP